MTYKEVKKEMMFLEMNLGYKNPSIEVLKVCFDNIKNYILENHKNGKQNIH